MAERITITNGESEREIFDKPETVERYKALGWKKGKAPKKAKPADDAPVITHPRDLPTKEK